MFEYIKENAFWIKKYAAQYDVPVIAVAGGHRDEYNTRFVEHAMRQAVEQLKESASRFKMSKLTLNNAKRHAGLIVKNYSCWNF